MFERVPTYFYNNSGEKVSYVRTARVDKTANLPFIYDLLLSLAKKYIIHRYFVGIGNVFWSRFTFNYEFPVLTFDYSENITLKPKHEAQSAHFSGRQHTLHCCVMGNNGINTYLYHLSDDTNHDNIMTFAIIKDVIETFPEVIANGKLILRSDHASTQYKSRFVFHDMKMLACEYNIEVVWFHGEAGHGRGLVDSMSSFGCKAVLRDAIITNNMWFPGARSMVSHCMDHFRDDPTKHHRLINEKFNATTRLQPREEHKLPGCTKFHLIAVDRQGIFTT